MKLHIKKNDTVYILTGEFKGKTGRVIDIDRKNMRVYVEGINLKTKHTKPSPKNPQGGIIKVPGGIHISNVALMSDGKPTRVGRRIENGKRVRYSKKTQKTID
ncbi:MAG: 50S ribosomal protein L24 [Chitinophagales bacterium]|nr:50S ribosomal protein L24 [Chitinophagales bacterium]MDW8418724.1 50S ribosomal protein L24 [Chitinophagales bacterium]